MAPTVNLERSGRLTDEGRERVATIMARGLPPNRDVEALHRKLLSIAGDISIIIEVDPDAKAIVARGILLPGDSRMIEGERSRCHTNSSRLWKDKQQTEPGRYVLFTGYAFSWDPDGVGCWRQHSWLWDSSDRIVIETTSQRDAYFGFGMTDAEASTFSDLNA